MVGQEEMFFASDPVYQKTVLLAMMNSLCCSFLMLVAVVGSKSLVFSPCLLVVPCRYTTFGMLSPVNRVSRYERNRAPGSQQQILFRGNRETSVAILMRWTVITVKS